MPDEIDRQEFGRLQAEVAGLRSDVNRMADTLDEVRQQLAEARGGWRAMMLLGGASAAAGGLLVKLLTGFKGPV